MKRFDAAALRAAGRTLAVPFAVELADGRQLTMLRILRLLPGKRIAGEAEIDGRRVLAKLFVASSGERHRQTEQRGIEALQAAGIATPELCVASTLKGGGHLVATAFVADAVSLEEDAAVRAGDCEALQPVLATLAQMHRGGLVQQDLHFGNFLRTGTRLLVIDGGAVSTAAAPLAATVAAENLGLLLAQLPAACDPAAPAGLADYLAAGGIAGIDAKLLQAKIDAARAGRLRDYLGKCVRDCSLFAVEQSATRFAAMLRAEKDRLAPLLAAGDQALAAGERLKSGNTCTVARVASDAGKVVIKRYNLKNPGHAFSRLWRPSRAWHSWREAHRLLLYGIATPQPLALVEERIGPLRRRAWLYVADCPGRKLLDHLAIDREPPAAEAEALAALFATLHRLRIAHGDLKASNLLWHAGRIWLIDLDAMTQHRSDAAYRKAWCRDRARLLKNWPAGSALHAWLERVLPPA